MTALGFYDLLVRCADLTSQTVQITDEQHEVMVIGEEIENLKMENKVLKRNNILMSRQIEKREKEENDLPFMYDRQSKEIKVLKDQLR